LVEKFSQLEKKYSTIPIITRILIPIQLWFRFTSCLSNLCDLPFRGNEKSFSMIDYNSDEEDEDYIPTDSELDIELDEKLEKLEAFKVGWASICQCRINKNSNLIDLFTLFYFLCDSIRKSKSKKKRDFQSIFRFFINFPLVFSSNFLSITSSLISSSHIHSSSLNYHILYFTIFQITSFSFKLMVIFMII